MSCTLYAGGMLSGAAGTDTDCLRLDVPEASLQQLEDIVSLQEALLLMRGLLGEAATHSAILDDLTVNSASTRICLAMTSEAPLGLDLSVCLAKPEFCDSVFSIDILRPCVPKG